MRAAVINHTGGIDQLQIIDIEPPRITPHDVLVRVEAAAVNPVDIKTRSGELTTTLILPAVLGWDVAGTVEAVGESVRSLRVGERVMGMVAQLARGRGTHAEFVGAPAKLFTRVPRGLSMLHAGAAPLSLLTARQFVDNARLGPASHILVTGAGGAVGRLVVQILLHSGKHQVSALAHSVHLGDLTALGVAAVYSHAGHLPELEFDTVLDTAGIPGAIKAVRDGGEFVSITDNAQPGRERGISPRKSYVQENGAQLAGLAHLLAQGTYTLPIARIYPLSRVAEAHAALEHGGLRGKVVLTP